MDIPAHRKLAGAPTHAVTTHTNAPDNAALPARTAPQTTETAAASGVAQINDKPKKTRKRR